MRKLLVVARHNKAEALRVAAGLTLLSDPVRVAVVGALEDTPAVAEQRELLEFAEVPLKTKKTSAGVSNTSRMRSEACWVQASSWRPISPRARARSMSPGTWLWSSRPRVRTGYMPSGISPSMTNDWRMRWR
jgi:hypothetical protein